MTLAALACVGGDAQADQAVVNATVYPGSQGSVTSQSIALSTLSTCTPYSGSNPIYLYPAGQPYQLPSSSWALSTVLSCGLHVPISAVTAVQILRSPAYKGFEAPLTSAQLSTPSPFADPQAVPAISTDGTEDLNTYTRPALTQSDDNAQDQVTEQQAPITIAVFEDGQPLTVHASASEVGETASTIKFTFSATVQTPGGTTVPATGLTWSWSFGDRTSSTHAAPTHQFAAGVYPVTVQVSDSGAGSGGTDTIDVSAKPSATSGNQNHRGGKKSNNSSSPVGPDRSNGTHPGGPASKAKGTRGSGAGGSGSDKSGSSGSGAGAHRTGSNGAASPTNQNSAHSGTTATATAGSTSTATTTPTTSSPKTPAKPHHHRTPATVRPNPSGPLVRGRLISDITPLSTASRVPGHRSSSARSAAPPVRQATRVSLLPALLGGLAVVVLLGLGAARELRGRGGLRVLRFGN